VRGSRIALAITTIYLALVFAVSLADHLMEGTVYGVDDPSAPDSLGHVALAG